LKTFGLIGKKLSHSFSKHYFTQKFLKLGLGDHEYQLFELEQIDSLEGLIQNQPSLLGFNVTIPYKQEVISYLTEVDEKAKRIGAVNTVVRFGAGNWKGFNTDYLGFSQSLQNHCNLKHHTRALVLGTGGASKAAKVALEDLGLQVQMVSRTKNENQMTYDEIVPEILASHTLIVNTTPLGMYPAAEIFPPIPYQILNQSHFLMDLVYNPEETVFLQKGRAQGASTLGGLEMLHLQADQAWEYFKQAF